MVATAGVPSLIQFVAFFFLPESPRWLVEKNRVKEAERTICLMHKSEAWRQYEMSEIVAQHEAVQRERQQLHDSGQVGNAFCKSLCNSRILPYTFVDSSWPIVLMLRTPHVRKALLLGCAIQMFQQLGGINTLM